MADKNIKIEVENNFKETSQDADKAAESVKDFSKETEKTGKNSKGAVKGLSALKKGVKGFGVALKGLGIGLIIGALVSLKEAFSSNQSVMDKIAVVTGTIFQTFSAVTTAIISAVDSANQATGGFDALFKVFKAGLDIALFPLKASFYGIKLGILELMVAWEDSFLGSGDATTIKNLNADIRDTKNALNEVVGSLVDAPKTIYNNFSEAVGEVGTLGSTVIDEVSKVSIKTISETQKALVEARNNAQIASAQQTILLEKYDRQAEKLRQIRDEERNSISERVKANEELKETLEKQEKAMLRQADLQIRSAQLEYNANKTIENKVALLEAQGEKEGVLATIEGFRSEQKANDLALSKEILELSQLEIESENDLLIAKKKALNELEKDDTKRLQGKLDILAEEQRIEQERLQAIIDSSKEGTLARLEAEIEYNTITQELGLERIAIIDEMNTLEIESNKKVDEENEKNKIAELERQRELKEAKVSLAVQGFDAIASLVGAFNTNNEKDAKRQFQVQKALNIASAVTNTGLAVTSALAQTTDPTPTQSLRVANAVTAGIMGLAQVTKIASTQFGGSGGGSAPNVPSVSGVGSAPNINVVDDSNINQIEALQQSPIQTFVVESQVTSTQALARNREKNASI